MFLFVPFLIFVTLIILHDFLCLLSSLLLPAYMICPLCCHFFFLFLFYSFSRYLLPPLSCPSLTHFCCSYYYYYSFLLSFVWFLSSNGSGCCAFTLMRVLLLACVFLCEIVLSNTLVYVYHFVDLFCP